MKFSHVLAVLVLLGTQYETVKADISIEEVEEQAPTPTPEEEPKKVDPPKPKSKPKKPKLTPEQI